ncbi:MAG: hypothetical protein CMH36_04515 [Microbacterium sp.]|jgi:uncharacterized membrane protein|uniref:DoxX family membrane protein n=1 Tax=Microbacterium ginsengisoli TaxID=400772 RepID=A0A0F0LQ79_9MICO|nr:MULTISPECIES: membrane protein [Microbacterium]MAL06086.1 hypothetical protein [Microbacterium sp.]KJL34844.1 hypothetical protein RR49_02733 [Microbacterium ginsengisoli]KJL35071.1 hypothetical protein RR49_02968 [Microbacterium ginsengisoli]KQR90645.1 hypothetical protein ASG00_06305 [Microbacterium sp. Leaf351]KQR96839.1 hypothetical protein ASF93_02370 [Microbacterium sp. Leaf347]|tara:strand:- start:33 stop:416 length:384 start_codon:yes stop_codon:yes gene_type:complete
MRVAARWLLGVAMVVAGVSHLTFLRSDFRAQVPETIAELSPLDEDQIVLASGVVEIALGTAVLAARRRRGLVGAVLAAFFVAVFPGNLAQFANQRSAFGLDTDAKRFIRLLFQPVLVVWALWATRRG